MSVHIKIQPPTFDPESLKFSSDLPLTQSPLYAKWQVGARKQVFPFVIYEMEKVIGYGQAILHPLPLKQSFLYLPYGPVLNKVTPEILTELKKYLVILAKKHHAVFLRADFNLSAELINKHFKSAPIAGLDSGFLQPRAEWLINLNLPEDKLYEQIHSKNRYCLRAVEKKRLLDTQVVDTNLIKYCNTFLQLMAETGLRNGFTPHPANYYREAFRQSEGSAYLVITKRKSDSNVLVVNFIVSHAGIAHYVFSASSSEGRELTPSYPALWRAILEAKRRGYRSFNLGGVSETKDPTHSWHGLSTFKKRFGGQLIKHESPRDLVLKPSWYWLYNLRRSMLKMMNQRGLAHIILLIIVAVIVLSYFRVDLRSLVESEFARQNFSYLWNDLIIELIWNNFKLIFASLGQIFLKLTNRG